MYNYVFYVSLYFALQLAFQLYSKVLYTEEILEADEGL